MPGGLQLRKEWLNVNKRIEVQGNSFADLGLPDAEERLAKAELAIRITETIRAAAHTDTHCESINRRFSRLLQAQLSGFSTERLMLTRLGRDVEITIKPTPRSRRQGRLRLVGTA